MQSFGKACTQLSNGNPGTKCSLVLLLGTAGKFRIKKWPTLVSNPGYGRSTCHGSEPWENPKKHFTAVAFSCLACAAKSYGFTSKFAVLKVSATFWHFSTCPICRDAVLLSWQWAVSGTFSELIPPKWRPADGVTSSSASQFLGSHQCTLPQYPIIYVSSL